MINKLSRQQLTQYERQSIVFPISVLSSKETAYFNSEQDSVYSGLHPPPSISAWIALTKSDSANGCMR